MTLILQLVAKKMANWPKVVQSFGHEKSQKMGKNGQKWAKLAKNGSKMGQKWAFLAIFAG